MTRRNTCPGCSHVIAAGAWWCGPCGSRMPSRLREAVTRAEAALGDARAAAVEWLGVHPHATRREVEVIALAAQGLPNDDIADRLSMTVDQVKDALRTVSRRWGCRGRAHVVATAFRLGYLQLEIPKGVISR